MNSWWTVGRKLAASFLLAAVVALSLGSIAYRGALRLTATADIVAHTREVQTHIVQLFSDLQDAEAAQRGFLITGDESDLQPYHRGSENLYPRFERLRALTADNPDQQKRLQELKILLDRKLEYLSMTIALRRAPGGEQAALAQVRTEQGEEIMREIRRLIAMLTNEESRLLASRAINDAGTVAGVKLFLVVGTGFALVLFGVLSYWLGRHLVGPLREVTAAAERIAVGDLDVTLMARDRDDEIGLLSRAFERMVTRHRSMAEMARRISAGDLTVVVEPASERDVASLALRTMVANLRQATEDNRRVVESLGVHARDILASATEMAAGASETATAVNETTTTVAQVRQATDLVSQKIRLVSDSAQRMVSTSDAGRKATAAVIEGMQRIREQMASIAESVVKLSEQSIAIGEIIASVGDLAELSNLLAVNAAIEAAKAGDQGKGFAVVADEVKALADQSKQATSQVRLILTDVQRSMNSAAMLAEKGSRAVDEGIAQSAEAGEVIGALGEAIEQAAQVALQIATSAHQQKVGMDQISQAMESIKQAGTQNAVAARQTESAALGLNQVGEQLRLATAQYRI